MTVLNRVLVCSVSLISCFGIGLSQTAQGYIVSAQRSGEIQFRDPNSLDVLSSIEANLPTNSAGLNGVLASPDGKTLYVEGPMGTKPGSVNGCCWLYAIDLATLKVRVATRIWGSDSRRLFVSAGPSLLTTVPDLALAAAQAPGKNGKCHPMGNGGLGWEATLQY